MPPRTIRLRSRARPDAPGGGRRGTLPLLLLGALATSGCSTRHGPPGQPPAASAPARPGPARAASPSSPNLTRLDAPGTRALPEPALELPRRETFSVQSAGDAPRALHRYALNAEVRGYAITARLKARSLGAPGAAGSTGEAVEVPPVREAFAVQTVAAAAAQPGLMYWRGEPIIAQGDPALIAPYVARWNALLAGRRATGKLDASGALLELAFAEDPLRQHSQAELTELTQRLLGLLVPLPDEPIGVGARWTVITVLRQGLGVVKQTARYELLAAADHHLTIAVDVRRVAEEQRVDAPGMPPGTEVDLVALFRQVAGRVELELGAPLPISGAFTVEARAHQRARLPDGTTSERITEDLGTLTLTSELR